MPPRKPIASRAEPTSRKGPPPRAASTSVSRPPSDDPGEPIEPGAYDKTTMRPAPSERPAKGGEDTNWDAPAGPSEGERTAAKAHYQTGADYPAAEGEDPEYATGAEYEAEGEPGGTVDLDADEEYSDGPRVGGPSETRISPLEDLEPPPGPAEDDDNATRAGPPIKLRIVAGPDSGKTKKFNGVRMVIGRTAGCELTLSDQSVSRRHLELVQGGGGVLLRDLGSGNGTKVNGQKVSEKVLQHDDEIAIGKTKFRYVDEMAAFKKLRDDAQKKEEPAAQEESEGEEAPASSGDEPNVVVAPEAELPAEPDEESSGPKGKAAAAPPTSTNLPISRVPARRGSRVSAARPGSSRKKLLLIGGGAGVALLLLLVIAVAATRKPPPPAEDPRKAPAAEKMQLARTAIRAEKYEEAVAHLTEAEKILPGVDTDKLLERATQEVTAHKAALNIRELIEQERFEDARAELAALPSTTAKREDEKKKLEAELTEKETTYRAAKAHLLLDNRELEAARQIIETLPADRRAELEAKAEAIDTDLKAEQKAEAVKGAYRAVAAKRARDAAHELAIQQAFVAVARKFHGGEYQRAAAECDRVMDEYPGDLDIRARAKKLQSLIPNFGRNFEEGHRKYKQGQLASSVKPLRRARDLYQQIGFEGALGQQIDEELAAAALAAGRDALARNDLGGAALNFRDAFKLDPSDTRARDGLDAVSARAEDLFTEAYMVRDRDPREAIAKFRLVIELTPPSSTTHQRAKSQLAALQPDKE